MNRFLLDASALVKRYAAEPGSALMQHLFANTTQDRLMTLMLGAAESGAALVRKRNGGALSVPVYTAAMLQFRSEILDAAHFRKLPADNAVIQSAVSLCDLHGINATDAIILRVALDVDSQLRLTGDKLILIAADQRLLRAAGAEGLVTFDPETQSQSDLNALI